MEADWQPAVIASEKQIREAHAKCGHPGVGPIEHAGKRIRIRDSANDLPPWCWVEVHREDGMRLFHFSGESPIRICRYCVLTD